MTTTVAQMSGERSAPPLDIEPAVYVDSLRDFLHEKSAVANSNVSPDSPVFAQIQAEEEVSRAFAGRKCAEFTDEPKTPEETGWISDGFSNVMARIVKATARAEDAGFQIAPFAEVDSGAQDTIRHYVLTEYIRLCNVFAVPGRKPMKTTYQLSPFLYYSPEDAQRFIEDNEDLGRGNVIRVLQHKPLKADEFIENARDTIETAIEEFPTIAHSQIRLFVLSSPNSYETALRKYAEKNGIALDVKNQEIPTAGSFLQALRQLARSQKYNRGRLHLPAETVGMARKIGKEAVAFVGETGDIEGAENLEGVDTQNPFLRASFQKKVEHMVLASNAAWRKGELPISPERTPEDFRRALYAKFFGEFLMIHVELEGNMSQKAMKRNPVLYYTPEEVRQIVADNTDVPITHLRRLIIRDPERTTDVIREFKEKVKVIMQANPRMLQDEAMTIAVDSPIKEVEVPADPERPAAKLEPEQLIKDVRAYLSDGAILSQNVARDARLEIEEHRPEIQDCFKSLGWKFADTQLPRSGRTALLKKVEEFIVANERAYRAEEIPTRLRDYTPEERTAIYELIGENYAQIANILGSRTANDWKNNPAIYIAAGEIAELRPKYAWLSDAAFRRVVITNFTDVASGLRRAEQIKEDLKKWYPGITDALASNLAVNAPVRAPKLAMEHLVKITERESRRFDSRSTDPNPKRPDIIYGNLRTLFRYGLVPRNYTLDKGQGEDIRRFRNSAAAWIAEQESAADMSGAALKKLLNHIECYVRASEVLDAEDSYPRILALPVSAQNRFIKTVYENQLELNKLASNGNAAAKPKFRVYNFGFFHDARYLKTLWRQYDAYLPRDLITYTALTLPQKPINKLNELVEYQATLLMEDPGLSPVEVNKAVVTKANGK